MKQLFTLALLAGVVSFSACKKDSAQQPEEITSGSTADRIAPDGFNFSTTKNVNLNITLRAGNDDVLPGVLVSVYLPTNTLEPIFKGVTNTSGVLQGPVTVPSSATKLIIDAAYVGVMRNATAAISSSNTITATIGGKNVYGGDIIPQEVTDNANGSSTTLSGKATSSLLFGTNYSYPSPYTSSTTAVVNTTTYPFKLGRPAYLEKEGDQISASLLSFVNASLPEGSPLTRTHPEYLSNTAVPNLNITETADVWITFVSEGAGLLNSLGYYTYKTGFPPTNTYDIDDVTIIFPNTSLVGSAGGLNSGDKVKLGRFTAGTSIGFVLLQNAWSTTRGVITNTVKFYSDARLNPETTSETRKHSVTLYDDVNKLFLVGFEDLNRQTESDNDFNDLVFYASSNPVTAISNNGVPAVDKGGDSDGDGVPDEKDAFPKDGSKAYITYYPSQSGYASIAFEDNWPKKGDFDLNDLVVNYRYTFVNNAKNEVVELSGEYKPVASGASFHNGFGVQLPVPAATVSSVTGQSITGTGITRSGNGVEAGQAKAVIIPFDNQENLLRNFDGSYFINTLTNKEKVTGNAATVKVTFNTPVPATTLQVASFNPFLIGDGRRGYEIHLPGFLPTDKANTALFNTDDDTSKPTLNRYYLSKENYPWAISFTGQYNYPIELQSVNSTYLHFSDWATSGGVNFTDWYSNTATGYRDASKIYSK
jgi:LruC domain-containing protein